MSVMSAKASGSAVPRRLLGSATPSGSGMGPPSRLFAHTPKSALSRPPTAQTQGHVGTGLFPVVKEQDPIQVFCRVKPLLDPGEGCIEIRSGTEVALLPPDNPAYWRQNQAKEGHYAFSTVFNDSAAQKAVFDEVALPLVAVSGKKGINFEYLLNYLVIN